jgi:hypothetical protein
MASENRMNPKVPELVSSIVSYLNGKGGAVTKTKLLKLLYLFDIEYYRRHGKLFTGFDWKFFHLGPWTSEFDPILTILLETGQLDEVPYRPDGEDFDISLLKSESSEDLRRFFDNSIDESHLIRVLNDWGNARLNQLLDYVYFRTEPMEHAVRNERLDFSPVQNAQVVKYKRVASDTPAGKIAKMKREYQARLATFRHSNAPSAKITPPNYDQDFFDAIETLERL